MRFESQTYYGEPENQGDIGLLFHDSLKKGRQSLKAFVLSHSPLDPRCAPTKRKLTVKTLLSPLSREEVPSIRGLGIQYPPTKKTEVPALFLKPVDGLVGPEATVILPLCTEGEKADYEVEICIVIGKTCRDVPVDRAMNVVAGFCVVNDVSCRGLAAKGVQFGMGKCFDSECSETLSSSVGLARNS